MINAHTHIYSGLAPLGLPPLDPPPTHFLEILERLWWRLDRALDAGSLAATARYYVAQALLSGTTGLIDHHESPNLIAGSLDILADACQELGIRAALTFGATERNGGREEALQGLAECRRFITENRRPLIEGMVGLHASFTVSDETVQEAGSLCRELEVPLSIHLAEDAADLEDARRRGYAGPLQRLALLHALPRGSLLAHGVHLSAEQVKQAGAAGCWLIQNPRSNRGNRVGFAGQLGQHPFTALGTDGYPSDLWEEAEVLRIEARMHGESPEVAAVRLAGSERLGRAIFGDGSRHDRVVRADGAVIEVVIAGRTVVQDGRLVTGDWAEIEARARQEAERLWDRMRTL